MKALITTFVLLTVVSRMPMAKCAAVSQWLRDDLSNDERNELVEGAKKEAFEKIAPTVLNLLVEYWPRYASGIDASGSTPWNNEGLPMRHRIYLMASAVWQHHMTPRNDPRKAQVLLTLLQRTTRTAEKSRLILTIRQYQWCPAAEQYLRGLCEAEQESLDIRRLAVESLLDHCQLDTYMPIALEIILAHEKGLRRCEAFNSTTNRGAGLFKLSEENRRAVLTAGFDILAELPNEELQVGYSVARRLGYILKVRNEFAPDQRAAKYQGQYGLKDEFFIDTVKNAREWRANHTGEMRSN